MLPARGGGDAGAVYGAFRVRSQLVCANQADEDRRTRPAWPCLSWLSQNFRSAEDLLRFAGSSITFQEPRSTFHLWDGWRPVRDKAGPTVAPGALAASY